MLFLNALVYFPWLALAGHVSDRVHQNPLGYQDTTSRLIYELKKAEIIPTVINSFEPLLTLSIFWEHRTAEVGNTVAPSKLQKAPDVQFINHAPENTRNQDLEGVQLTVALTDPDAPSRDNPEWSEVCHWLATNVQLTDPEDVLHDVGFSEDVTEIMPYKPPGPPPKTGKHRYVFVALAPKNRTTDKLNLSEPGGRQHWGFKRERQGVREWASENGLDVVGANFIYAQNKKQ